MRELRIRKRVYPRLVYKGKMTEAEARKETQLMGLIIQELSQGNPHDVIANE